MDRRARTSPRRPPSVAPNTPDAVDMSGASAVGPIDTRPAAPYRRSNLIPMLKVDVHTHTRFFHAYEERPTRFDPIGARLLVALAKWRGLDAVVVTNHDYHTRFDFDIDGVTVVPGIEVSTTEGHVLLIGSDPPERTAAGTLTPEETLGLARNRGCAAVVAHPFRNSSVREFDAPFDAYEVNGKRSVAIDRIRRLAEARGKPLVGGSDAHYPIEVGRAYTKVDADEATPGSIVDAIRDGRVEYELNETHSIRLLRRLYGYIHRHKDHIGG